jgi:hypothetical protein
MRKFKSIILTLCATFVVTSAVHAATYQAIIVDTSTSMDVNHCILSDGFTQGSRLDCVKEQAAGLVSSSPLVHQSLWRLSGYTWSDQVVKFKEWESTTAEGMIAEAAAHAETMTTAIGNLDLKGSTPMASVVCMALDNLRQQGNPANDKYYLILLTDAGENASTNLLTQCANQNTEDTNVFDFHLDITTLYSTEIDDSNRSWAPESSIIPQDKDGRTFVHVNSGEELDWAGGVEPGSWEWRMYHRVSWGKTPWDCFDDDGNEVECSDEVNAPLITSSAQSEDLNWENKTNNGADVIINIVALYEEIFPTASAKEYAPMLAKTKGVSDSDEARTPSTRFAAPMSLMKADFFTLEAAAPSISIASNEFTLFEGLTELTGGQLIESVAYEPLLKWGDINNDQQVDFSDLAIILTWHGRSVDPNNNSVNADIFNDGFIDNLDIELLRNNWTADIALESGDVDYNQCVDSADWNQVMQWYGGPVLPGQQHSYRVDLNPDGVIDDIDLQMVINNWCGGCVNDPCNPNNPPTLP